MKDLSLKSEVVRMVRIVFALVPAALALSVAIGPAAAQEAQPPAPAQPKLPAIVVTKAVTRPMVDRVIATGTIKPVDEVYVAPLVEGLSIRSVEADVSDRVSQGQVLARLNDDALILQKSQYEANKAKAEAGVAQYRAQVLEAEANLADARRQRDRTTKLSASGTSTQSQVEQAQALVEVNQAKLNAAIQAVAVGQSDVKVVEAQIEDTELNLARTAVKSPVSGVVSVKNARIGAIAAGSGDPLFTLIKDGAIELVADLSETDIQKVEVGQTARVTLAGGSRQIDGKVRLVSPSVDATTRLGAVHIIIGGQDGGGKSGNDQSGARAGMYARAEIVIQQATALALPLSAVTTNRGGSTTRKVEDGVVRQVKIGTGIQDGGFVQVLDGLSDGDTVVAKAGAFVRDGDHIAPVTAPAPADAAPASK